jgi:hypothetical protein
MARTNTVGNINLRNITWENDCLLVSIPQHKGDQTGENSKPKHIYSNVFQPEICPVLGLALYILSGAVTSANNSNYMLYDSTSPESAYTKWLHEKALKECQDPEVRVMIKDIGTHSFRKGSATFVTSFDVISEANINLRAGWTNGKVRSKYIFGTPGADQLIGRLLCGLDIHNVHRFLSLPAHISNDIVYQWDEWLEIEHNFADYPSEFKLTFKYLVASLAYHYSWIVNNVHKGHPIFRSRVWNNGLLPRLREFVTVANKRCSCCLMAASGTPTLWSAFGLIEEVKDKVDETKSGSLVVLRSEVKLKST